LILGCLIHFLNKYNSRISGSIKCNTSLTPSELKNVSYDFLGIGMVQSGLVFSQKLLKYELFPFTKVFENDTDSFYSYDSSMNGLNIYQSSLINEKGLRVEEVECFRDLIELLNESQLMKSLNFKIDYLNKQLFGSVKAKVYFTDFFL
jgi:hypothetical protein